MSYKVVIPVAGTGSRLGGMTRYLNKCLVSIGNKPALSRIIEMFPDDTEFVIPVGYKGELIKEFVSLTYLERKIQFTDVLLYEGEGSGLGLSLLTCEEFLQCPFIFCSCDTLVNEKIPEPSVNWMGYDERDNLEQYRTIHISDDGKVLSIDEKGTNLSNASKPYIGLAGIHDYKLFWEAMKSGKNIAIAQGESYGLRALLLNRGGGGHTGKKIYMV
jgi:NDP-sugar pyrophosphorylase family protein